MMIAKERPSLTPFLLALFLAFSQTSFSQGKKEESGKAAEKGKQTLKVSKEEMQKIVSLDEALRPLQIRTQKKIRKNMERSELGQQRLDEIRRAKQSGDDPDMTKKEKKQLKELRKENERTQRKMKAKMKKKVKAKGMSWKRYRKLRKAVHRHPDLRKRYRRLKMKRKKEKQGNSGKKPSPDK
ncbi:MAG: DUF4168 domain-containing protein [Flavobacteriales bacterium]